MHHYIHEAVSSTYCFLGQQDRERTGLEIIDTQDATSLTSHFVSTIYHDASAHAFFSYKGFEGVTYAINGLKPDWHELRFDGMTIALAGDIGLLERCQEVHDRLVTRDRKSTRLNSSHIPLSRMPSSA